jgi:hypothetical protein
MFFRFVFSNFSSFSLFFAVLSFFVLFMQSKRRRNWRNCARQQSGGNGISFGISRRFAALFVGHGFVVGVQRALRFAPATRLVDK